MYVAREHQPDFWSFEALKGRSEPLEPLVGRKAASLVTLLRWNLPVPPGGCLATTALQRFLERNGLMPVVAALSAALKRETGVWETRATELAQAIRAGCFPEEIEDALGAFLARHPGRRFAVRSSGTSEDAANASFAGLYTTLLNVAGDRPIAEAIKECWASLSSPRVLSYAGKLGRDLTDGGMGVVLQVMVPADKSGVAFSVNPLKGFDTEVVIEACFGLGEGLVSGIVTPDQYTFDWYHGRETGRSIREKRLMLLPTDAPPFVERREVLPDRRRAAVLSQGEVREIATLTAGIQARFGFPVDIEWAMQGTELFVLQSRPITKINFSGIEGEWTTADFKDGGVSAGVCTPFMWSLYDSIWERTLPAYLKKVAMRERVDGVTWGRMFYGRPYWNVAAVKEGLKRLPGFVERTFDQDLGIEPAYEGAGYRTKTTCRTVWTGLKVLARMHRSFAAQLRYCERFASEQECRLQVLDKVQVDHWPDDRFFGFYRTFINAEYFRSEASYFNLIYDSSNVTTLFRERFKKIASDVPYLDLISGLTDVSHLRQSYSLWGVVESVRGKRDATRYWSDRSIEGLMEDWQRRRSDRCMDEIRAHIDAFKYHGSRELDLAVPRFDEDPRVLFESVKQMLSAGALPNPREAARRQGERFEVAKARFLTAVPFFRRRSTARQLERMRRFLWWREELRDLSMRYYYHVRRFTLELEKRLRRRGMLQQEGDVFFLSLEDLYAIVDGVLNRAGAARLVARNRRYYDSFRNFANPNELGQRYRTVPSTGPTGSVLNGIGCSPGVVHGTAKVIQDIFDADRLAEGDILVTKFTDPGWTSKFSLLRAVVTETGGLLSHAAVIAREYGIPAVLAVADATQRLRDGEEIRVDGDCGEVVVQGEALCVPAGRGRA